ncbi:MAG: hypothetical protein AB7E37_05150 [Candidatus Altimarinota bacterium]
MFKNKDFVIHNRGQENEAFEILSKEIFRDYLKEKYGFDDLIKTYKNQGGLECDPVNGVGFQAKFFENNIDWKQVNKSVDIIIKNLDTDSHRNYNNLKVIIFFLNFELTKNKLEQEIVSKLDKFKIEAIFFTDYQKYFYSSTKIQEIFLGKHYNSENRFRYYIDIKNEYEIKEYLVNEGKENFKILLKEIFSYMSGLNKLDLRDLIIHDDGFSLDKNNELFKWLFINQQKPFEFEKGVFDNKLLDDIRYIKLFQSCFCSTFRKKTNRSNNLNITDTYTLKRPIQIIDFKDYDNILSGIGYDETNSVLALKFYSNNMIYHYIDFPIDIYNEIIKTKKYSFNLIVNYKYAWLKPEWANFTLKKGDSYTHYGLPF